MTPKSPFPKTDKKSRAPGGGLKAVDGAMDLARKQVRMDAHTESILSAIGGGNLSLGIREAARRLVASNNTECFEP